MIKDFINKEGIYVVRFENFNGSGWDDDVIKIIKEIIKPQSIQKSIVQFSWDNSVLDYNIKKDTINFISHFDDSGPNSLRLISEITEDSKQKLREWATIIAQEVEKLKP